MSEAERKPYEDIRQEKVKEYNEWKEKVKNTARYKEIVDYWEVLYVLSNLLFLYNSFRLYETGQIYHYRILICLQGFSTKRCF